MVEHKFALDSMSSMKPKIVDTDAAVARHRERALASAAKQHKQSSGQRDMAEMLKSSQPMIPAPAYPLRSSVAKEASKHAKKK
ncbi:hypothetical protein ACOSP7_014470 [Xanthoceras sorbifolium]